MYAADHQTLEDLEFPILLDWLHSYAIEASAKKRIGELQPLNDFNQIRLELKQVHELHQIRTTGETFPALDFEELQDEITYLKIKDAVLKQESFRKIYRASELINSLLYFFDKRNEDYPLLSNLLTDCVYTKELIEAIDKVFDKGGQVKDDASPALAEIRTNIQILRTKINRNFDKEARRLLKENVLAETKETFVNERRVLAVLSSHKRMVPGIVVGSSKTGSITFIEPKINIELNSEFEMALDDERKEIYRILKVLTKEIAVHYALICNYQKVLVEFDFIQAKVRLALHLSCSLPGISEDMEIELRSAYHPILKQSNDVLKKKTLPQSIRMDKFSRMLVISGPNAGGKSITLKTIGLLQVMLQSGLLVPVDPNSTMCLFQKILTDIGDNQSIENELSTYSYRLRRMHHFLEVANRKSLLLLDEFGTGSDPDLGGALAEVFFEELYNKKSFGVFTTHYANIKLKADQLRNAVNGCMLFDTDTLEPLYKFSVGQPGSSFTFEVAQINGIPKELIDKAKQRVDQRKIEIDALLSDLQKEKNYFERLNQEHRNAQEAADQARMRFEERKERLDSRLRTQQDKIEKEDRFIHLGKKMSAFIDRYKLVRKKDANNDLWEDVKKYLLVEKSKIEGEKKKAAIIKKSKEVKVVKAKPKAAVKDEFHREKIKVGSTVKLISTKQSGTVEEINGNVVTVVFGFLRMKVELEKLMWIK